MVLSASELKEILRLHKLWLDGDTKGKRADLSGAYLSGANLSRANLSGANLSGANLSRADLPLALPDLYLLKLQPPKIKLTAWKYLENGKSPYQHFEYEVGKTYTAKDASTDEKILCDVGLNVATLSWCLKDTNYKTSKIEFLEVEFTAKDIAAVPIATDGKFRVTQFKVLRKINRDEAVKFLTKHCNLMKEAA